jgi:hypothetical protein
MVGLYKTIALFVFAALALAYANERDVGARYPATDSFLILRSVRRSSRRAHSREIEAD